MSIFFFFNDTATTEIYTLSLHDALPISSMRIAGPVHSAARCRRCLLSTFITVLKPRSEEHTSELQSPCNLVCRLLLEKKKAVSHGVHGVDHVHPVLPQRHRAGGHVRERA